jgi:peptidoglycan/xylan/chitin deacetylase (PgdA/CDA1 family)
MTKVSDRPIWVLVRNDDICALSDAAHERRVFELFERYGVPMTIAVIPNIAEDPHVSTPGPCHPIDENRAIIDLMCDVHGRGMVEIAHHGLIHQTNRFRTGRAETEPLPADYPGIDRHWSADAPAHPQGFAEFADLPASEQRDRVLRGRVVLERALGLPMQTFIFPWNAYDATSIEVLANVGYRFVPAEDDDHPHEHVQVIGACVWDWELFEGYDWPAELESSPRPVLAHFGIHSWVYGQTGLHQIEAVLKRLTSMRGVRFILPSQLPALIPELPRIAALRARLRKAERRLERVLGRPVPTRRHYVLDASYYRRRIARMHLLHAAAALPGRPGRTLGRAIVPRALAQRLLG